MAFPLSALTLVKLTVLLLGLFNAFLLHHPSPETRTLHIQNDPALSLRHLLTTTRPVQLFTEESVHYAPAGPLADAEWASLVPAGNHGLVLSETGKPYAITMFHTLHCLDRIRRAIVYGTASSASAQEPDESTAQARHHVGHCFNYVRQMVLCAANTRLNPDHVSPSGQHGTDGIGLTYACRDWNAVYDAFEANYALNRTMTFA